MNSPSYLGGIVSVKHIILLASLFTSFSASAAVTVETFIENVNTPWSIAIVDEDTLIYTSRNTGQIHKVTNGQSTLLATIASSHTGEGGLLGIALDQNFKENNIAYICYTYRTQTATFNRTSAVNLQPGAFTEQILVDQMPGAGNHNGCRVVIGPDDHLYISMGEAGRRPLSQDLNSLGGKILRVKKDGSIPLDNPFGTAVWTWGHRNPQGLAFHPVTNELWSTEHGPGSQDELNKISKGKNYGWPTCQGIDACPQIADYVPAVREFDRTNTIAISNMIFYSGKLAPRYTNAIMFVSLKTGRLYILTMNGDQIVNQEIVINNEYGRLRDIVEDTDGTLLISNDRGTTSRILRVRP
jgi:aldose sugar dehydrogenase